jgi:predicted DNA-binding transcriptional regulator AlpA
MKLGILKCLITVCFFFSVTSLTGQDTSVIGTISFPHNIRSMANDENGLVFIESSVGLYQFDGKKYWLIDPNYNKGALIYTNGKLSNFKSIKDDIDFIEEGEKNKVWLPFLPSTSSNFIYHAKGKNGRQFLARDNQIYEVRIKNKFKIDLKGYSTRAIMVINGDTYVNTYSGIFKNGMRILPNILNAESMLFENSSNTIYFTSDKDIYKLNLKDDNLWMNKYLNEIGEQNYISKIVQYKNKIYLGTSKGLAQLEPFSFFEKEFFIHDISIFDDFMYIATEDGSYQFDGNKLQKCDFLPNAKTNLVTKIGVYIWALTNNGLFAYNTTNKKLDEIILNKELTALEYYAIQRDNNGFYWVSTSSGLYRFGNINEKAEVFFSEIEFNKRSFYNDNGILYFGSVNGIYSFDPLDFPDLVINNGFILNNLKEIGFILLVILGILLFLGLKKKGIFNKKTPTNTPLNDIVNPSDKDKFLFDLGTFILSNLHSVTVEDLLSYTGMSKKTFYKYLDQNYKILPGSLINNIKVLKARALILENPGITMETVSKFTGYSASHLYIILKQEDPSFPEEIAIIRNLKY